MFYTTPPSSPCSSHLQTMGINRITGGEFRMPVLEKAKLLVFPPKYDVLNNHSLVSKFSPKILCKNLM